MSFSITPTLSSPYWGVFFGYPNQNPQIAQLSGSFVSFCPHYILAQTQEEVLNKANDLGITDLDPNQSLYYNLPNGNSVAVMRRNGSSTITTLIAQTFFPNLSAQDGLHINTVISLSSVPTGVPHAIVRDPIERFKSAYAKKVGGVPNNLEVNDFINWLIDQDQGTLNWHFRPQTIIIGSFNGIKYYDFKTQLNQFASDIGLPVPLPTFNETLSGKPTLTDEQINTLNNYYAADLTLYATVTALNNNI